MENRWSPYRAMARLEAGVRITCLWQAYAGYEGSERTGSTPSAYRHISEINDCFLKDRMNVLVTHDLHYKPD
jgi:hypothetical protein